MNDYYIKLLYKIIGVPGADNFKINPSEFYSTKIVSVLVRFENDV